jgi:hypothetical protein
MPVNGLFNTLYLITVDSKMTLSLLRRKNKNEEKLTKGIFRAR